jgi:DNA-binding FadR family transcriptional regulator
MNVTRIERSSRSTLETEFPPIVKIDVTEEIIGRIKSLLANGKLKPGSKLPPEREFAYMLGVGRPALRQALKALSTMGIIDSQVGRGTFVNASSWELLVAPMDFMMLLNAVTIKELFEVRRAIEVELAGMAAERATAEHVVCLRKIVRKQEEDLNNPDGFLKGDIEFHSVIGKASRNILFLAVLDNCRRLMTESRRQMLLSERDLSLSLHDHQLIVREIAARDGNGARKAMLKHLDRVYRHWEQSQSELVTTSNSVGRFDGSGAPALVESRISRQLDSKQGRRGARSKAVSAAKLGSDVRIRRRRGSMTEKR